MQLIFPPTLKYGSHVASYQKVKMNQLLRKYETPAICKASNYSMVLGSKVDQTLEKKNACFCFRLDQLFFFSLAF